MLQADSITKLSKSSRNALVIIENQTSLKLIRKSIDLIHGSWIDLPGESIAAQSTSVLSVGSVGVLIGCEIALQYQLEIDNTYAHEKIDDIRKNVEFYCCTPYVGSPYSSVTQPPFGLEIRIQEEYKSDLRLWIFTFVIAKESSNAFYISPLKFEAPFALSSGTEKIELQRTTHPEDVSSSTAGQMMVRVIGAYPLNKHNSKSFYWLRICRRRSFPPEDIPAKPKVDAIIGEWTHRDELLTWSKPRFVNGKKAAYFNETFTINVDDEIRDGVVVQLILTSLLGAKQTLISERVLLAASVLPEKDRVEKRLVLEKKHANLTKLLNDYDTLYDAQSDEKRKMLRDLRDLNHSIELLKPETRFQADTTPHDKIDEAEITLACSYLSTTLSAPTGLKHSLHIGATSSGFKTKGIPPEWKELFRKAGVLKNELDDPATLKALMSAASDSMSPLSVYDSINSVDADEEFVDVETPKPHDTNNTNTNNNNVSETTDAMAKINLIDADKRFVDVATPTVARKTDDNDTNNENVSKSTGDSPKHQLMLRAEYCANEANKIDDVLLNDKSLSEHERLKLLAKRETLFLSAAMSASSAASRENDIDARVAVAERAAAYQQAAEEARRALQGVDEPAALFEAPSVSAIDAAIAKARAGRRVLACSFSEMTIDAQLLPEVQPVDVPSTEQSNDVANNKPEANQTKPVVTSPPPMPPSTASHNKPTASHNKPTANHLKPPSGARVSLLDQIRASSQLELRDHTRDMPNVKQLEATQEVSVIDALKGALSRRREQLKFSSDAGSRTPGPRHEQTPPPCHDCGAELKSMTEVFNHSCVKK